MKIEQPTQRVRDNLAFGFSLLEMVMAAALVTGTVVPALAVIRDAMAKSRDLHRQKLRANYAVQILEEQAAYVAAGSNNSNWDNALLASPIDDNLTVSGFRFTLTFSDSPGSGGLTNRLMNIEVTVYDDADGDLTLDADELQETYRTKVAKLNTYENDEQ